MKEENLFNIITQNINDDTCLEDKFYQGYESRTLFQAKPKENKKTFLRNYNSDSIWMEYAVRIEL